MKKLLALLFLAFYSLTACLPAGAAPVQTLGKEYIASYFNTVAAASCLGVYLPETSGEFSFLRSYGWDIEPQVESDGKVEAHFAIASNYFSELDKQLYLITFRGSASKEDWKVNLQTQQVNYGGTDLDSMDKIAAAPFKENFPTVHAGFNSYVNTVLRNVVLDENGNFKGVFKKIKDNPKAYLILTGHSLGGAAATLLGERLISLGLPKDKFTVITFGAPAIGNSDFVAAYGDKINLYRITNTADPIPGSLQTFFSGYKQFGEQIKYRISPKQSGMQHDIAMYFDYSVSEFFKAYDQEVELGHLSTLPDKKIRDGQPLVALWIKTAANLNKVAYVTDLERFVVEEYQRLLPSYIIMNRAMDEDAFVSTDIIRQSRNAGADYVLVCGMEGNRPPKEHFWYLTLEQALFDAKGNMLSMCSLSNKIAPAVGNIQAAGQNLLEARKELNQQLPFVKIKQESYLGSEG